LRNLEKAFGKTALKLHKGFVLEKNIDPAEIDHSGIKNILIIVRHQMGDMLCAVPMMRSVRSFYPAANITLLTKKSTAFEEIFKDNNSPVDEVINYEHGFEKFLNVSKALKDKGIDLAIIPSTVNFSATNHMAAYYSGAKYKVGVRSRDYEPNPTGYILNIKNDFLWDSKKVHQVERNLDVIRQINIKPLEQSIKLSLREENKKFAEDFLSTTFPDSSKPVIGFHPGAGKEGNVWAPEKFAELAYLLNQKTGAYIFISEGPMDTKYVNETERLLKEKYNISNFAKHKGGLMNNTAIISMLNLFITNDTGVMHLASGFKVPVIALFGPTKAYEWGPVGENKVSIQAARGNINNIELDRVIETSIGCLAVKKGNN
jgi:ADP-heptose:LPS heptosyltransferase